jgi:tetratricopeptide (TPR) repeat protein
MHLARAPPDRERTRQAAEAFRAALAEEGGFARAQAALCATETLRFEYWNDAQAHGRARVACARAASDGSEPPPEVSLALGNLRRVDGEYDAALEEFRRAAADPGHAALANVGMAKVEAARGDAARAREHFDRALALAPDDPLVRAEAGFQAWRDGNLKSATAHYRRAVALDPDHAGHWNTLGFLHLAAGDTGQAVEAFERSIAIQPSADVLGNFGTLRLQSGDYEAAVALFRRALELDPDDYINWGNLADGLSAGGAHAEEAAQAYSQAERRVRDYLALDPDDGYALAALGWYCANLDRRDEALALVRRSRDARGDRAEIALYNAETLAHLGDREGSALEVERARQAGMTEARLRASTALREQRSRAERPSP